MMKRFTAILIVFFLGLQIPLYAQVIFYEDFDNVGGPTSGGPGTYTFPAGWLKRNVDNFTPASAVSYINEAWERREDFGENTLDSCAFSTSWYAPVGIADDWMWTPLIGPLPANCKLKWNAKAYDPSNPDGYSVRIMTVVPTGGTGTIGNQITNSTEVFTIAAEATIWTSRQVDLAAYTGQSIYIGFRNNSNDKFVLLIDDIEVSVQLNYNAALVAVDTLEYTMVPLQQTTSIPLNGYLRNNGLLNITNVQLKVNVYDEMFALQSTFTSSALPTLAPGATQSFSAGAFTPTVSGAYYFEYLTLITEADGSSSDDTLYNQIYITDTTYARDNGSVTGALGIGVGNGFLGQQFTINAATDLRSVTSYITKGYTGRNLGFAIWDMPAGVPLNMIATTDTLLYPDDSARLYTLNIHGGPLNLLPGDYAFTIIEFDSTVQLAQTSAIFTPGTTWVNWATSPAGTWANNEYFGTGFAKSYLIRPNMYLCPLISNTFSVTLATCGSCPDGNASALPAGGNAPYTYAWSNGDTLQTISTLLPGDYFVTITDAMGCSLIDTVNISYATAIEEQSETFMISPNPNEGVFEVVFEKELSGNASLDVFNAIGELIFQNESLPAGTKSYRIDLQNVVAGPYVLRLTTTDESIIYKFIVQ
jgi:hypothetical protein